MIAKEKEYFQMKTNKNINELRYLKLFLKNCLIQNVWIHVKIIL